MPTALIERPSRPAPLAPPRKRWTREECEIVAATGLWDQQRLELIEGELISRMGRKRPHVNSETSVRIGLGQLFSGRFVEQHSPIDVAPTDNPANEPVPDIIVLARPSREIRDANPQPEDLRLVVEISDSSVSFDLTTKADLYARAGIAEYWVVDILARRLIVHRDPRQGLYQSVTAYSEQEAVSPLAAPDHEFRIAEAFLE